MKMNVSRHLKTVMRFAQQKEKQCTFLRNQAAYLLNSSKPHLHVCEIFCIYT